MESREITDEQITASSQWDSYHAAIQARLHFPEAGGYAGGWAVAISDENQWLQVDLKNKTTNVTGVATQGRSGFHQWVTKYNLQFSDDGVNFYYYMEQRNVSIKVGLIYREVRSSFFYYNLHPKRS